MSQITAPILLDSTGQDIAQSLRVLSGRKPTSWEGVVAAVNSGRGAAALPVGTQMEDTWGSYAALWDTVHHDSNGNLYLHWHYTAPQNLPFDAPEAIYAAGSGGLAAGTYYISIGSAFGSGWTTARHIQFTLTRAMQAGDQLVIDCGADNTVNPTAGRTWSVFHAGGTEVLETGVTSNGTSGSELGTVGAVNVNRSNGQLNAISRAVYGYSRWSQSALRQYLNSTEAAGAWWTPQNIWDRPPAQHGSVAGFLAGCSAEFLDVLRPVEVSTTLSTQEGFTDTSETTWDRIFLPSLQEIYAVTQVADTEGEDWDYYKTLAGEAGLSGRFVRFNNYPFLLKYGIAAQSTPYANWLRSPDTGNAYSIWRINSAGAVGVHDACMAIKVAPACKIMKSGG